MRERSTAQLKRNKQKSKLKVFELVKKVVIQTLIQTSTRAVANVF